MHGAVIPMIRKISGKVPSASRNVVLKSPYEKRARALMRLCARQNHQVLEISSYRVNFWCVRSATWQRTNLCTFLGHNEKEVTFWLSTVTPMSKSRGSEWYVP